MRILCLDDKFIARDVMPNFFDGICAVKGVFIDELLVPPVCVNVQTIKDAMKVIKQEPMFDAWTLDYNLRTSDGTGIDFLERVFEECPDKIPEISRVYFHSGSMAAQRLMKVTLQDLLLTNKS